MTNKVEIPVQCKERNDVLVAYKGVLVSLIPLKIPCIAIESITAGAPNDLNIKYCCAGFNIGEFCIQNKKWHSK
jgi:hypothetical protein